ncbi:MAG: endonuclease III [Acidobacteria bacterium]|nr:endonuclease III [Acidobacteriota bacterium]
MEQSGLQDQVRFSAKGGSDLPELKLLRLKAARIAAILHETYGSPHHNNKSDPLDELVFILLSQMTTSPSFERVYDRLKERAPEWEDVRRMQLRRLRSLIKDAGLSNQKAPRIKAILDRVYEDFHEVTLEPITRWSTRRAETYLTSLPGVQTKTAKCVLMYSLKRPVLPVDTHVWRVAMRLGLIPAETRRDMAHEQLETVIAPRLRYGFHVNAISHGRELCRALAPKCGACPLTQVCNFYQERRLVGCDAPAR